MESRIRNPYNWHSSRPRVEIPRPARRRICEGAGTVELLPADGSPLRARFAVRSEISAGLVADIVHFLLGLPRR